MFFEKRVLKGEDLRDLQAFTGLNEVFRLKFRGLKVFQIELPVVQ